MFVGYNSAISSGGQPKTASITQVSKPPNTEKQLRDKVSNDMASQLQLELENDVKKVRSKPSGLSVTNLSFWNNADRDSTLQAGTRRGVSKNAIFNRTPNILAGLLDAANIAQKEQPKLAGPVGKENNPKDGSVDWNQRQVKKYYGEKEVATVTKGSGTWSKWLIIGGVVVAAGYFYFRSYGVPWEKGGK